MFVSEGEREIGREVSEGKMGHFQVKQQECGQKVLFSSVRHVICFFSNAPVINCVSGDPFPSTVGLHRHNRAIKKTTRYTRISARTKKKKPCQSYMLQFMLNLAVFIMIREVTMPCV